MAGRAQKAATQPAGSRARLIAGIAGAIAIAVVVVLAVTAQGYQAQEVPRLESSVWVLREAGQYARVNTELAEIDTVRAADSPEAVWQSGASAVLFSQGSRQRWDIDPANPEDLLSDAGGEGAPSASVPTPAGTREIVSAGPYIAYRTDTGQVSVSSLEPGAATALVDPFAGAEVEEGDEPPTYVADAIGLSPDGVLALYSSAEGAVRIFDIEKHRFTGDGVKLTGAPEADGLAMTVVGDRWALLQAGEGRLWMQGGDEAVQLDIDDDAKLQNGSGRADALLIADASGLVSVTLGTGDSERIVDAEGVPAAPVAIGTDTFAAWIGADAATLWADGRTTALEVPGDALESVDIQPVFRANGDRAVLSEVATGLIWTAPDGRLVPLEQWDVEDETEEQEGAVLVEDVAEQLPPTAVDDAFGVRAGTQVVLPVLLNDHDPNRRDVLTIEPSSVAGGLADPAFGAVSLVANGQSLVIDVRAGSGQTAFTYAVTDGTAVSPPATVTLTVVDDQAQTEPVWCGVDGCRQEWPSPELLPGGSTIVPVMAGWVDPEGDPLVLSDAYETDPAAPVMVVPTADGRVAIRHTDPNAGDAVIPVTIVMADSRGATSEKTLEVRVRANPSMRAMPVALTARVGEPQTVRVADHLTGGSGSYRLLDAVQTAATADGMNVVPNPASGEVEIVVTEPGQYVVAYTAQDATTQAEQSAVIRITAVDGTAPLAMAPVTAFVREGEDTTVDVLHAVQNTSGRVLILSGAVSSSPQLAVNVVGNERLRVSGTTADGEPGVIGTAKVTVADGSGAAVEGIVTVFLAPPSTVTRPIVFPDAITVRAGALTRIHVTANDVAPRGEPMIVLPEVTGSGEQGELVFADGDALRYLAPTTPGTYRLTYAVSLERNPELYDTGSVVVTVVPPGTNRAPNPPALTARVLSGQTVSVSIPTTGVDADGDRVALASVGQPAKGGGTATISATGDAIVYRAPAGRIDGGQVTFRYTVRDSQGAEGEGRVRVGVLDAGMSDASPVAYSDYIRVEAGSETPVVLTPAANDSDPGQGELEIIEVVPNAPTTPGNPLYERLDALIDPATSLDEGRVVLRAGEVAGTNSYIYTVRSTRTMSTSQGLIVVSVTEGAVADQPRIADTVLTARDRAELAEGGVDVVTDRVQWASGDVGALTLRLWGDQPGFSVDGARIIGTAPEEGALIPFQLTGTSPSGRDVAGYGFLRVPAFDDMRVQLEPGVEPVIVDEDASKSFNVRDLLDLPGADVVEIGDDGFAAQRAAATCEAGSGTTAVYRAGREAPWSDTCLVPVRLQGQRSWSYVDVPIGIRPAAPQLVLSSVSHTVSPGATQSIDLHAGMASWEGGREGDASSLQYRTSYSGSAFIVTQQGSTLTAAARADARPGTVETVAVSVPSYGEPTATLRLVVGAAAPDAPRGATLTRQCVVTSGSCSIDVVGTGGEYDPFAGQPGAGLELTTLGAGARCDVASFSVSGAKAISVTWPGGGQAPGGQCVVPFTVADAQGRTGPGMLTLDLQGFPQAPASVATTAFTRSSVELEVVLGEAARAHPAVTGISILQDGAPARASCAPAGRVHRCTVSGLVNGEPHAFAAAAVNAVGTSAATSPHTTWAYAAPEITNATAVPVYRAGGDRGRGSVELTISAGADARAFRVSETGEVIERTGATTTAEIRLAPGSQSITLVPISQFQPPIGSGNEGGAYSISVTVAGAPYFDPAQTQATAVSNTAVNVSGIAAQANGSTQPLEIRYLAWRSGRATCTAASDGGLEVSGAEVSPTSPSLQGLEAYEAYNVKACVSNGFGVDESATVRVFTFTFVDGPGGDTTYTVATTPTQRGDRYSYPLASAPAIDVEPGFVAQFDMYGSWRDAFTLNAGASPGQVRARACHETERDRCSGVVAITATTAPTVVDVEFGTCVDPAEASAAVTVSAAARGSHRVSATPIADVDDSYEVTLSWVGAYETLSSITTRMSGCS